MKIVIKKLNIIRFIMVDENNSIFSIRKFNVLDTDAVVNIWKECGLVRGWNNTELDIQRKLSFQEELFFCWSA